MIFSARILAASWVIPVVSSLKVAQPWMCTKRGVKDSFVFEAELREESCCLKGCL